MDPLMEAPSKTMIRPEQKTNSEATITISALIINPLLNLVGKHKNYWLNLDFNFLHIHLADNILTIQFKRQGVVVERLKLAEPHLTNHDGELGL